MVPSPQPLPQTGGTAAAAAAAATSLSLSLSSSSSTTDFTPQMRDRQARGKDPYDSGSEDGDWPEPHGASGSGGNGGGGGTVPGEGSAPGPQRVGTPKRSERFALQDRRRMAAQVLDSPELLIMAALRDDLSYPATRLKYTRILCGLEESRPPARAAGGTSRSSSHH
ncbi:hypothetical protein F5X97DRAFT_323254 [Nemania serpens]|nr:hypothetical protein F5X97DRAFT_323254 [Nemania serpens]